MVTGGQPAVADPVADGVAEPRGRPDARRRDAAGPAQQLPLA